MFHFRDTKQRAIAQRRSAKDVVYEVFRDLEQNNPGQRLPKLANIIREINKFANKNRPANPGPDDKKFDIKIDALPANFYRIHVTVGEERHLIFATEEQLQLLAACPQWFIDGTFAIIDKPFMQLFSISGFINFEGKKDDII